MKKLLTLAVAAAMTLSVAAASATTLKLSEVHAEGYPTTLADQEFARLIEEKTEGRIKVEVYSGGQLYGEETGSIEALQLGDIAFARVSASPVASYVPALNAIQMPYLYKNADHMWAVLDGEIGKDMLAQIEASGSGLVGLCWYDAGARSYYTTKKVASVADMKGLKIRMQNNAMMVDMTNVLGGTGVTGIGPNEVTPPSSRAPSTALRTTGRPTRTWATTRPRPSTCSTSTPAFRKSCSPLLRC